MYIFIIMIVVLLSIYLFSNFITPEKPKVVITYYPPVSAKPVILETMFLIFTSIIHVLFQFLYYITSF